MTWQVIQADCIEAMQGMDESSVDAIVTDPPYGLEFMGKEWDRLDTWTPPTSPAKVAVSDNGFFKKERPNFRRQGNAGAVQAWHEAWATEALRVLKPGGHLLAFGGTRTYHRLACGLEDAGFEIRDCLAWLYGSGFPKSLDVSKAIDKAAGAEREVTGLNQHAAKRTGHGKEGVLDSRGPGLGGIASAEITAPATPEAERWQGWGTALKPAMEPVVLARKPLTGTVAANVLEHGTGALNIDGTRIEGVPPSVPQPRYNAVGVFTGGGSTGVEGRNGEMSQASGRWPANVLLDEEAAGMLDEQSGETSSTDRARLRRRMTSAGIRGGGYGQGAAGPDEPEIDAPGLGYSDTGGASRFFYVPKADREERNRGLGHRMASPARGAVGMSKVTAANWGDPDATVYERTTKAQNTHPTVKPVELMQWLCRLITPPKGTVLDPFTGSGTTGIAALREGFSFVGIEREPEYVEIARDRIIGDAPLFNVQGEVTA